MSGVTRIGHMGLRVKDLDDAVEFQADVLGLVETERHGRIADRLAARGQKLTWGPSRHGPGHNLFIYFKDADGAMIECCADLAAMPPHGDYGAKRWPGGFSAINQWGGPPPPRFLLAGHPIANTSPPEWLG